MTTASDGRFDGIFAQPAEMFQLGIHHFSFWVDDIDAIHNRAKAAGATVVVEPSERGADTAAYGEPPGRFVRTMFINDPDGWSAANA